jgi:hypothetical protein
MKDFNESADFLQGGVLSEDTISRNKWKDRAPKRDYIRDTPGRRLPYYKVAPLSCRWRLRAMCSARFSQLFRLELRFRLATNDLRR